MSSEDRYIVGARMEGNLATTIYVLDTFPYREVATFEGPSAIADAAKYAAAMNEKWAETLAEEIPF